METVATDAEWVETFKMISKEEINSPTRINKYDDTCHGDKKHTKKISKRSNEILEQRKMRMMRMQPLFASQPRLEKICKDWSNDFVDSGFTSYVFSIATTESFEEKENDIKYLINLCGYNLTNLQLHDYRFSQMMPLIKSHCFNLTILVLRLKKVVSKDFDNVFSNMKHLENLIILWQCENSTLPMTLIKSIDQVRETLKKISILCIIDDEFYTHDKSVPWISSVLSPETEALISVISNMKNLESVTILLDYGFTDKFFINLINNSKNLKFVDVCGSHLTDKGLIAINNLNNLKDFSLGLNGTKVEKKFITDQSIQCLLNKELSQLDISDCIEVTNRSIIELVKNLPNLQSLYIENTKATIELVEEIAKLKKDSKLLLTVHVSFKVNDDNAHLKLNPSLRFTN